MKLFQFGSGEPTLSIVGGTHGDEPMTTKSIRKVRKYLENVNYTDINKKIQLIIANEPALQRGERYLEADLNRVFPGNPKSKIYEERLAYDIHSLLSNSEAILSLHSTKSAPPPFAMAAHLDNKINKRTIKSLPVDYVVDTSSIRGSTMDTQLDNTVTVEIGHQGNPEIYEFGYKCCIEFLKMHKAIDGDLENGNKKHIIKAIRELPKFNNKTAEVHYNNFERLNKYDKIAEDETIIHMSLDSHETPILMSKDGYSDIFGLIGKYTGENIDGG